MRVFLFQVIFWEALPPPPVWPIRCYVSGVTTSVKGLLHILIVETPFLLLVGDSPGPGGWQMVQLVRMNSSPVSFANC